MCNYVNGHADGDSKHYNSDGVLIDHMIFYSGHMIKKINYKII